MDAAIAAALAREAVKKKPVLEKAEVNAHKPKEKVEVEPQLLTELKKAELKERESFQVNVEPAPSVNVQLKKAEVQERPKIEVNANPLPKVELRKTKPLSSDISAAAAGEKSYTSSGPSVQLKKTDGPTTSSSASSEDDGRPTKEPQFAVKLKKTEIKERPSITTNSTTLPGMSILKKTEASSSYSSNSSNSTTSTQIDFKANLRKPGKGRMKHLEKFYDTNNTNDNTADQ